MSQVGHFRHICHFQLEGSTRALRVDKQSNLEMTGSWDDLVTSLEKGNGTAEAWVHSTAKLWLA